MAQPVGICRAGFGGDSDEARNELQLVFVDHGVNTRHLVRRLDGRVVEWTATETVGRRAVEDCQHTVPRAHAGLVERLLIGHSPGVMDAAQIRLHQLRLARKVLIHRAL
jgi:hypothetical protein